MTENVETRVETDEVYVMDENIGYVIAQALFPDKSDRLQPYSDYLVRGFRLSKLLTGGASCSKIKVSIVQCDHGAQFCCHCLHKLSTRTEEACKCPQQRPIVSPNECVGKNGWRSASHSGYDCDHVAPYDERNQTYGEKVLSGKRTLWVGGKNIGRYAVTELMTIFSKDQDWYLLRVRPGNDHADIVIGVVSQELTNKKQKLRIWSNDWNKREWPSCQSEGSTENIIVSSAKANSIKINVLGNSKRRKDAQNNLGHLLGEGIPVGNLGEALTPDEMVSLVESINNPWNSSRPAPKGVKESKISSLVTTADSVAIKDFCMSAGIRAADIQGSTVLREALVAKFKNAVDEFAPLPRHSAVSRQHQVAPAVT